MGLKDQVRDNCRRDNMREPVKDFYGRVLGWIDDQGDKIVATDFYGRRLGVYDKARDFTSDFFGVRVCDGDGTVGLIMKANGGEL
jgi:hypothetical protein